MIIFAVLLDLNTGINAAKKAKEAGIRVFVLSVGTAQGGPIPMYDGTFKKDLSGNVVTTKLNEQIGKNIAQAGGGMYIHVDQNNMAQAISSAILSCLNQK